MGIGRIMKGQRSAPDHAGTGPGISEVQRRAEQSNMAALRGRIRDALELGITTGDSVVRAVRLGFELDLEPLERSVLTLRWESPERLARVLMGLAMQPAMTAEDVGARLHMSTSAVKGIEDRALGPDGIEKSMHILGITMRPADRVTGSMRR